MRKMLFIFIVSCSVLSCDKDRNKQYSTWYINGESFYSRAVSFGSSKGGTYLTKAGTDNGFSLGWRITSPPQAGYIGISTNRTSNNPEFFFADFYQDGDYYRLSIHNPDSVLVSYVNGKIRYEMAPAWFENSADPGDSIVISGTFDEP